MLFNSYIFIFLFLPITVVAFHTLRHYGFARGAIFALVVASFIFYAWWKLEYLILLLVLMGTDFLIARQIQRYREIRRHRAKGFLILGLLINIGALGYYKYANFFSDNVNTLFGMELFLSTIILPIGISFFTFQKIAFLIDLYQGKVKTFNLMDYALFITFFPQLIAGPIVHHSEMMPQFAKLGKMSSQTMVLGITIFIFGLSKKILLADTAAGYVSPQFDAVLNGTMPDLLMAWSAALSYTAQIYFDFSAYSDMAIGIGLMFGIKLPVNFDSPYKSASIIEFWRRWHITLSRFLRDYLYIPLGGNRKGPSRRYMNLYITMLLGGIWHGAGWTFLIWGALHGIYLIVNHSWHIVCDKLSLDISKNNWLFGIFARGITLLSVIVAWIFFRAANIDTALDILRGMSGQNGLLLSNPVAPVNSLMGLALSGALLLFAFFMPNTQQLTGYIGPSGDYRSYVPKNFAVFLQWKPSILWAVYTGVLLALCLMGLSQVSEFIYFQF
ncbi:MAG: MBOAT family protein [Kiritimatiellae bacterium]|nr:MBOAT family protein [Kiritimatiellia bacterium]